MTVTAGAQQLAVGPPTPLSPRIVPDGGPETLILLDGVEGHALMLRRCADAAEGLPVLHPTTVYAAAVIDLHAHVLPGIDDGPASIDESLALLRVAALAGTRVIAATPHLRRDFPKVRVEEIARSCRELQQRVPVDWALEVVPGGEVDLAWAMGATDGQLQMASYGGRGTDLLVETPYKMSPRIFEPPVARLMERGFRITLAHPELNGDLQESSMRLEGLIARGVLVQITAASLLANPRRSRRARLARRLVEQGQAHVIASDAHSAGPRRPPGLQAAVDVAMRLAPERAEWMVTSAPAAILSGEPLPPLPFRL